jgi:methylmalonyl-CoA mutase cobalamin-binding domain/chain
MEAVEKGLTAGIREIGKRFGCGEAFLPEMVLAADAMQAALEILKPHLGGQQIEKKGKILIATVQGDNHDIGKNVVAALLVANGFKVVDVGINSPPKKFLEAAEKEGATIIAASTLITTALPYQREIVQLLADSGNRQKYFVVVGGGPVASHWAGQIGADGYGRDGKDAVEVCLRLADSPHKPPVLEPIIVGALKH